MKANYPANPSADTRDPLPVHTFVPSPCSLPAPCAQPMPGPVERQAAIENALSLALYYVRRPDGRPVNLWRATARAHRALSMLKQASQGIAPSSHANATGRA